MSGRHGDDTLQSAKILDDAVQALVDLVTVNRDFDIPYLAGMSIDGQTVYIDREFPYPEWEKFLIVHETTEHLLMDRGMSYRFAHQFALRMEKAAVKDAAADKSETPDIDVDDYDAKIQEQIDAADIESIERVPSDLDLRPYVAEKDDELLERMKQKMEPKAMSAKYPQLISLRSYNALGSPGVQIDPTAGIIRGASLMSEGPAKGHGFDIDRTMLAQITDQINENGGVKVRLEHPTAQRGPGDGSPMQMQIGRVLNARLEDDRVRGDIQLGGYASMVPGMGDVKSYLMTLAKEDPTAFGASVVFKPVNPVVENGRVLMRSGAVSACDLVAEPAANRNGLLSVPVRTPSPCAPPRKRFPELHIHID